jgi:hypothetical protein
MTLQGENRNLRDLEELTVVIDSGSLRPGDFSGLDHLTRLTLIWKRSQSPAYLEISGPVLFGVPELQHLQLFEIPAANVQVGTFHHTPHLAVIDVLEPQVARRTIAPGAAPRRSLEITEFIRGGGTVNFLLR